MGFLRFILIFFGSVLISTLVKSAPKQSSTNVYKFHFKKLTNAELINLSDYKGKVILIVNTASKCGFTPQFNALEKLYLTYKDRGFVIIGVPSNDFGGQEPLSNQEIEQFCKINFGVTFPMAAKEVVTGKEAHPFFTWAGQTLGFSATPRWNFYKYLIDRHGNLVEAYSSFTKPDAANFTKRIEELLKQS